MSATTVLSDALARNEAEARRRGLRALLRKPLLVNRGHDAESFVLVRRHASWLREWFLRETGWFLHVEHDVARLRKIPADTTDATRPALSAPNKTPFGRKRYALTCLALAALERADLQITLGRLAEHIIVAATDARLADAGVTFRLDDRSERSDLVAVCRLLVQLGVLTRVAGDENDFVLSKGDALYDIERRVLARLLVGRGPSTIAAVDFEERIAVLGDEVILDTPESKTRAVRHRLTRKLLDDPVVYYDDLSPEEIAYLDTQRAATTRRITDATGLVAEARAEGIAMLDPIGDITDVRMPEEYTEGHATLLLAEHLAAREGAVDEDALVAHMAKLIEQNRKHWKKAAGEPGGDVELCRTALARLEALRLVTRDAHRVIARPAIVRFSVDEPRVAGAAPETEINADQGAML